MMKLKTFLKKQSLALKLRHANYKNLNEDIYISKTTIINTDKSGDIVLNNRLNFRDYCHITAKNNGKIVFGKRVFIGDYTIIQASRASILVGNNVLIGPAVKLISTNHAFSDPLKLINEQDIIEDKKGLIIEDDCWLGAGSVVLPGVTIRKGTVVGANAVVTKTFDEYSVLAGSPAKIIGSRLSTRQ